MSIFKVSNEGKLINFVAYHNRSAWKAYFLCFNTGLVLAKSIKFMRHEHKQTVTDTFQKKDIKK